MAARFEMDAFVSEIAMYQFLYDKSSKDYKNVDMKKAVWELIAKKFGMSAPEAEKKWKVQRDRYNKEKKKIKESTYSGAGSADVYTPKWSLFKIMDSLLSKCSENSSSISSIDLGRSAEEQLAVSSQSVFNDSQIVDDDFEDSATADENNLTEINATSPVFSCASFSTPAPGSSKYTLKRKREKEMDPFMSQMQETTKTIAEYFSKKKPADDSVSKFCEYLACRLKDLKKKHRRDAMHAIENIMQKKEIENDEGDDDE